MNITIRWSPGWPIRPQYAVVSVQIGSTQIETGLLDAKERKQLADHLREVADELSPEEEEE